MRLPDAVNQHHLSGSLFDGCVDSFGKCCFKDSKCWDVYIFLYLFIGFHWSSFLPLQKVASSAAKTPTGRLGISLVWQHERGNRGGLGGGAQGWMNCEHCIRTIQAYENHMIFVGPKHAVLKRFCRPDGWTILGFNSGVCGGCGFLIRGLDINIV